MGSVTGIYFTGSDDDIQQWARIKFQVGVRTVPAGSLQFVDFSKPDPGAERVQRFLTAAQHAMAEGDYALAAQRLVYARDAEPGNVAVLRLMTLAFWQAGDLPAAGRTVRDWARADRERPAPHRFAARIYEDMGAIDLAVEAAERAAERAPSDASNFERIGRLRLRLMDRAGRAGGAGARARLGPTVEGLLDLALAHHLAGDLGGEVTATEQATLLEPADAGRLGAPRARAGAHRPRLGRDRRRRARAAAGARRRRGRRAARAAARRGPARAARRLTAPDRMSAQRAISRPQRCGRLQGAMAVAGTGLQGAMRHPQEHRAPDPSLVVLLLALAALLVPAAAQAATPGVNIAGAPTQDRVDEALATGRQAGPHLRPVVRLRAVRPGRLPDPSDHNQRNFLDTFDAAIARINAAGAKPVLVVVGTPGWANGGAGAVGPADQPAGLRRASSAS